MKECLKNLVKATMKQVTDYATNAYCLELLIVLNCNSLFEIEFKK